MTFTTGYIYAHNIYVKNAYYSYDYALKIKKMRRGDCLSASLDIKIRYMVKNKPTAKYLAIVF